MPRRLQRVQGRSEVVPELGDVVVAVVALVGQPLDQHRVQRLRDAIEKLRLVDRLEVRWDIAQLPMRARIPSLTIQPLIENAIYHGIELLPDGGEVTVTGTRGDKYLEMTISNPVAEGEKRARSGNKMALANIRQRFELAYGHRATVTVEDSGNSYAVRLRFPHDERAA